MFKTNKRIDRVDIILSLVSRTLIVNSKYLGKMTIESESNSEQLHTYKSHDHERVHMWADLIMT